MILDNILIEVININLSKYIEYIIPIITLVLGILLNSFFSGSNIKVSKRIEKIKEIKDEVDALLVLSDENKKLQIENARYNRISAERFLVVDAVLNITNNIRNFINNLDSLNDDDKNTISSNLSEIEQIVKNRLK